MLRVVLAYWFVVITSGDYYISLIALA